LEVAVFSTIVVGVDGREGGRDAISLAAALRAPAGAHVVLAHAYPYEPMPSRASSPAFEVALREAAVRLLEEERGRARVDADVEPVADTSPARALQHCAEHRSADLLVIGSSHHGALGRVLAGDVAGNTLHGAPCPVAIAPREYHAAERIARIGVGFDGTPESQRALELAVTLARETSAPLHVVAVVSDTVPLATGYGYAFNWADVLADRRIEAQKRLTGTVEGLGVPATGEVRVGGPANHLEALSRDVNLLLLGSRGFGPVRRVMLGSTSGRLAQHAQCPLVVVPRGAAVVDSESESTPHSAAAV
jgi:nucleotide-binding universal stress UspA family protein